MKEEYTNKEKFIYSKGYRHGYSDGIESAVQMIKDFEVNLNRPVVIVTSEKAREKILSDYEENKR